MIDRTCEICSAPFRVKRYYTKIGRGRFCSKKCSGIAKTGENNPAYKHGNSKRSGQSKEYQTWSGVKKRVLHGSILNRPYYIDRGITMCDRWFNSFENFLEDMGEAPSQHHQIDRIDVNGNYEPDNCRWVTRTEQMNNVRSNVHLTYNGTTMTQEQWGRETGLGGTIICKRLKRGWTVERALTTPLLRRGKESYNNRAYAIKDI